MNSPVFLSLPESVCPISTTTANTRMRGFRERYANPILPCMRRLRQAWGMNQRRDQAWAKWRNLVSEQEQSGQSVAGFCRERGLPNWCTVLINEFAPRDFRKESLLQQYGYRSIGEVGHGEIEFAVAIKVRRRDREGALSNGIRRAGRECERPIALTQ